MDQNAFRPQGPLKHHHCSQFPLGRYCSSCTFPFPFFTWMPKKPQLGHEVHRGEQLLGNVTRNVTRSGITAFCPHAANRPRACHRQLSGTVLLCTVQNRGPFLCPHRGGRVETANKPASVPRMLLTKKASASEQVSSAPCWACCPMQAQEAMQTT